MSFGPLKIFCGAFRESDPAVRLDVEFEIGLIYFIARFDCLCFGLADLAELNPLGFSAQLINQIPNIIISFL